MPEATALDHFKGKYCRMCGAELGQSCVSIFGEEGKRLNISEKIRKTLSVLILEEDLLPKKICTECCSNLEEYSHYRETVLDAQEKLSIIAKSLLLTASPQQPVPGPSSSNSRSNQSSRCSSETSTKSPCQSPPSEANTCKECGRKFGNKAGLEAHLESEHPQNPVEAVEARAENSNRNPVDHSNADYSPDQNSDHDQDTDVVTGEVTVSEAEIHVPPPPPPAAPIIPPAVTPHNFSLPPDSSPEVVGYECEFCEKILASSGSYHNHISTAHKGRKFTCPHCPYSYSQKASLTAHIRAHHTTETAIEKTHQCDVCPAKFFEKKFLTRHKATHMSVRTYECEICHKFYKTSMCLAKHTRIHTNAKAFVCPTCGKGFSRRSRLQDHLNTHNNATGITCPSCTDLFNSYPSYAKHFKKNHPEVLLANGKIPSPLKKNKLNNNQVTVDTRTLQVITTEQQEDSLDNYVTNSSAPTPLTGQNLSMTPGNSWNESPNKQQSTLTFHQHNMNGLDLVDCAIQSALINDELEHGSDDLPSQSGQNLQQLREPQHQQSQNLPMRETQSQNSQQVRESQQNSQQGREYQQNSQQVREPQQNLHLREAHQQQQHTPQLHFQAREVPQQHSQMREPLPQQHLQRETQQQQIYQIRESQLQNFQTRETSQQHSQMRETLPQQHLQQARETQQQPVYQARESQLQLQTFQARETSQLLRDTPQQHLQIRETVQQHSQHLRPETQPLEHHSHSLNQHPQHDPNQPMELCYKSLTTDNTDFQDMPMQLTKVLQQSGPLELCVRSEHEQQYNQLVSTGPSSSRDFANRIDSMDLSVVAAGFQQQPIDLISRNEVCSLSNNNMNSSSLIQGNNLVDLSLRSTLQEQSTSSFIRELLDLSARSEYHEVQEQPMELNLSCSKSNHTSNLQINNISRPNTHYNHPNILQNNSVEYSEAMFSLQNYN